VLRSKTVAVSLSFSGGETCCCPAFGSPAEELRGFEDASSVASIDSNVGEDGSKDFDVAPAGIAAGGVLSSSTMDGTCTLVQLHFSGQTISLPAFNRLGVLPYLSTLNPARFAAWQVGKACRVAACARTACCYAALSGLAHVAVGEKQFGQL
jgi:hypothetical protein